MGADFMKLLRVEPCHRRFRQPFRRRRADRGPLKAVLADDRGRVGNLLSIVGIFMVRCKEDARRRIRSGLADWHSRQFLFILIALAIMALLG